MNNYNKTENLAKLGILAAISVVLVRYVHFPLIPGLFFLEYDPADITIFLGTFAMGPLAGLLLTVVASLIQGLTVSAQSGWYGILMHIIATGSYVLVAGNIYAKNKTKKGAIIALIAGTLTMAAVMVPANLLITPLFTGWERSVVLRYLPGILLFNFLKAGINSLITFLIYKRVSPLLHK